MRNGRMVFRKLAILAAVVTASLPGADLARVPGSATWPPEAIEQPSPAAPGDGKRTGVTLGVWIAEDGTVESAEVLAGGQGWRAAALAAVRQWRFKPVVWEGKAIPARAQISFLFQGGKNVSSTVMPLPNLPGELHEENEFGLVRPALLAEPEVILPLAMRAGLHRRLQMDVSYVVNEKGMPEQIEVLGANSESALRCGLDNVAETRYQPATVRGVPVKVKYAQSLGFSTMAPQAEALQGADDLPDPVYPHQRLLEGEEGFATVKFGLDDKGGVLTTEVLEASHPDFGAALVAAVESWSFTPESARSRSGREYRHEFVLSNVSYATRRLVQEEAGGGLVSQSAKGLDARPELLAKPALAYPKSLLARALSGEARVEFVIDRTGLAQKTCVLSATEPEFGWSAATCVNGMRFKPLTRKGQPTELKVVLPFTFTPPATVQPTP